MMTRRAIGVSERPPLLQTIPLSLQHLFAMFGATVLVPILFHINPATVLLFNGVGTLLYLFICKGKIPAYLGSSFAFISPVLLLLPLGYEVALGVPSWRLSVSNWLAWRRIWPGCCPLTAPQRIVKPSLFRW